jgi:hypothetical protein
MLNAAHDLSAILVETESACLPPTAVPMVRIPEDPRR